MSVKKYHPALIAIHWIMAFMIIVMLVMGGLIMQYVPNDDPSKVEGLAGHMTFGALVALFLVVRFITRVRTQKPDHAPTGSAALDTVAKITHWAFYAIILGAVGSGIAMSMMAGLPDIVFFGSGDPLPESFWEFPPRIAHRVFTWALAALIVLHVAAALWHQFGKKDGLISRMWFGGRKA